MNEWISVRDRMPENTERVLAYCKDLRLHCGKLEETVNEYETRNSFLKAEQETLSFNISNLQKRCDTLEDALLQKELECARLHQRLKKLVEDE